MAKSKKSTSKKPVAKKEVILETKEVKKEKGATSKINTC